MAITISGTTGIAGVDGSAGTPAVQGTDTNTGVFYPAADTVGVSTGGSERVRVDSSGNVGIGTSTPAANLDVQATTGPFVRIKPTTVTSYGYLGFNNTGGDFNIGRESSGGGSLLTGSTGYASVLNSFGAYPMQFGTNGVLRMTIDSSGNLLVNTTATSNITKLTTYNAGNAFITANTNTSNLSTPSMQVSKGDNNTTTSNVLVQFLVNGFANGSGQINANGANAAAFGSFSDSRLKQNIVDLPSQLANIMALRPVEFDYIESEGGGHQIGFVAQEVKEIYPDLVGEREDGMFTLSDLNKNDARLIKAIQELKALVDTQASTITALTARIEALEAK